MPGMLLPSLSTQPYSPGWSLGSTRSLEEEDQLVIPLSLNPDYVIMMNNCIRDTSMVCFEKNYFENDLAV